MFVEFVTILILFYVSDSWPGGICDLSPSPGIGPALTVLVKTVKS